MLAHPVHGLASDRWQEQVAGRSQAMRTAVRLVVMLAVTAAAVLGSAAAASANMPTAVEYAVMLVV